MGLLDAAADLAGDALGAVGDFLFGADGPKRLPQDFEEGFQLVEQVTLKPMYLYLTGNMLPHQPFDFGGTQHVVKDFYAGNAEPVVQVLGAREDDLVIKGRFHSKRYSKLGDRTMPEELQRHLDLIRLRGNLLCLTLGEWERYGYLTDCKWSMKTLADIDYQLTFTIVGFSKPDKAPLLKAATDLPYDENLTLNADLEALQEAINNKPKDFPLGLAGTIDAYFGKYVAGPISAVQGVVNTAFTTAEGVVKSYSKMVGVVQHAKTSISIYQRRLGLMSYRFQQANATAGSIFKSTKEQGKTVKKRYSSATFVAQQISKAGDVKASLDRMQKRLEALKKTVPKARRIVRQGDTLHKIAIEFYGDPMHWETIYKHNRLRSSDVPPGKMLEIPNL